MFTENKNILKLSEKVFIYKNFVSKEKCDEIVALIRPWENVIEKNKEHGIEYGHVVHLIDWYNGKISPSVPQLYDVWCQINELLLPEYCIHPQMNVLRTSVGDEMFVHSDSPGESMEQDLTAEDRWNTCCILHYGAIVYFGEWEGGEVFYPNVRNDGTWVGENVPFIEGNELSIKPEPGDLIIHGALDDYAHGVKKITSGVRYAFSNFVLPAAKNPGTFPLYGTEENEKRWSLGVKEWLTPIDFEWKPSKDLENRLIESNAEYLPPQAKYPSEIKNEKI